MTPLLAPVIVLSSVGLALAALLAVGRKLFYVEVDERQERIQDILPGANCGGCGYPGCSGYAAALIQGKAEPTACPPGGADLAGEIGAILGVEVGEVIPQVAVVACAGDNTYAPARADYLGLSTCTAVNAVAGGTKKCAFGCFGLGTCADACPFGAIVMTDQGLAVVVEELCNGCGNCVAACPRNIIKLVPAAQKVHVLCNNPQKSKETKAVCQVGCTGCKLCLKQSGRFKMNDALAFVNGNVQEAIPETVSLVCATGAILDTRNYGFYDWITKPACRETHAVKTDEWKAAEKKRKAEAKAKKKAKQAAKEQAAKEGAK